MLEEVPFAIVGYLFLALVDITSKIARTRFFRDSLGTTSLLLMGQAFPVVLIFFIDVWSMGSTPFALSLAVGAITAIPYWLYSESLKREEVSRVSALWQTIPIFVLLLAYIFLQERLPQHFYISLVFLIAGGLLVSSRELKGLLKPDAAFWMMLLASFTWAAQLVFIKSLYSSVGFLEVFVVMCLGRLIAALLLPLLRGKRHFFGELLAADRRLLFAFFLANTAGVSLYHYSVSLGSVTVVEAISGFQAFFTLLFALALSRFAPAILRETTESKAISLKAFAITLMFIGLILLYF